MGKKSGPSAPPPPDPAKTAAAQAAANKEAIRESAIVNQINQRTPYGQTYWEGEIGTPERTQITELTPGGQEVLDKQTQLGSILGQTAIDRSNQIDPSQFEINAPEIPTDLSADRGRVEQAYYDRQMNLLRPEFERQEERLDQKLANRGIPVGSKAYADEYDIWGNTRNQAMERAAQDAILAGGGEQSRLFGLSQAARQQGISDQLLERTQPMNEIAAILQGSPALPGQQAPSVAQYQQAPANISGLIQDNYNAQLQNWQNQQGNRNSMWGNVLGTAGTVIGGGLAGGFF
jgi:hypothetical protein